MSQKIVLRYEDVEINTETGWMVGDLFISDYEKILTVDRPTSLTDHQARVWIIADQNRFVKGPNDSS